MNTTSCLSADWFYLSSDRQFVLLAVEPVEQTVDANLLASLFAQSPFNKYQTSDKAMQDAAAALNKVSAHQAGDTNGHSVLIVARRLDGQLEVRIAKDEMSVTVVLTSPFAGAPVSEHQLRQALEKAGVTQGVDSAALSQLIRQSAVAEPGVEITGIVARGELPRDGADSRFVRLVPTLSERVLRPQLRDVEHDRVDLRDLGAVVTVAVDEALMRRYPPEPGICGFTVTGTVLPAKDGSELPLMVGAGSKVCPDDRNLLLAEREGLPIEIEHGMTVDEVLTIQDVTAKFGHIDFSGSIMIKGNVCDGMRVKAGGCITVGGVVDSAHIEAGSDLIVEKGIIGHPVGKSDHYSCTVHAGGKVIAKFAQYADISADGDVVISSQLLHAHVLSAGCVIVSDDGRRKGTLLGGSVCAGEQILAVVIGGQADSSTHLMINGDFGELLDRRKQLRSEIEHNITVLHQLDDANSKVAQLQSSEKRSQLSDKIAATRGYLCRQLKSEEEALEAVNAAQEAALARARIYCCRHLYPGVSIDIAGMHLQMTDEHNQCQICHRDGELVVEPLLDIP